MTFPLPLNPVLENLPVYQPGRPIEEVAREIGLDPPQIVKLASNENPLGPSPAALEAIRQMLPRLHLYPDGSAHYLKLKLADRLGLTPDHLILGNGSNEIIEFVGHACLTPSTAAVVSQYCFAIYPIVARLFGAQLFTVAAQNYGHDLEAMLAAVTPETRVVFVANPNNPTGTLATRGAVQRLVEEIPSHVLLVMDEAYLEFLEDPTDLIPLVRSEHKPNLLLLRTFSKIYGLAGLRLGYGIGHPSLIAALEKIRQPFNTNAVAQAAAFAALDDTAHLERTRRTNAAGLAFFETELRKRNLPFVPSAANFILARVGNGQAVFQALQQRGMIVRPLGGYELPEWIRLTIGTAEQNARCLAALDQILAEENTG